MAAKEEFKCLGRFQCDSSQHGIFIINLFMQDNSLEVVPLIFYKRGNTLTLPSKRKLPLVEQSLTTKIGAIEEKLILHPTVVVNCGYDTYFTNGLVMDYADCKCSSGLVETSK